MKRGLYIVGWFILIFAASSLFCGALAGVAGGAIGPWRAAIIAAHPGMPEQAIGYVASRQVMVFVNPLLLVATFYLVRQGRLPGTNKVVRPVGTEPRG